MVNEYPEYTVNWLRRQITDAKLDDRYWVQLVPDHSALPDGVVILQPYRGGWRSYSPERLCKIPIGTYETEAEACKAIYQMVQKDAVSRAEYQAAYETRVKAVSDALPAELARRGLTHRYQLRDTYQEDMPENMRILQPTADGKRWEAFCVENGQKKHLASYDKEVHARSYVCGFLLGMVDKEK